MNNPTERPNYIDKEAKRNNFFHFGFTIKLCQDFIGYLTQSRPQIWEKIAKVEPNQQQGSKSYMNIVNQIHADDEESFFLPTQTNWNFIHLLLKQMA